MNQNNPFLVDLEFLRLEFKLSKVSYTTYVYLMEDNGGTIQTKPSADASVVRIPY